VPSDTSPDKKNVLTQTVMSVFENEDAARFAADRLVSEAHLHPKAITLIAPRMPQHGQTLLRASVGDAYWEDGEQALQAGRVLLIATVDEVDAFRARELLEEDMRSQRTLVLPPEPARPATAARRNQKSGAKTGRGKQRQRDQAPRRAARAPAEAR
jgi:hypothetical protein